MSQASGANSLNSLTPGCSCQSRCSADDSITKDSGPCYSKGDGGGGWVFCVIRMACQGCWATERAALVFVWKVIHSIKNYWQITKYFHSSAWLLLSQWGVNRLEVRGGLRLSFDVAASLRGRILHSGLQNARRRLVVVEGSTRQTRAAQTRLKDRTEKFSHFTGNEPPFIQTGRSRGALIENDCVFICSSWR